MASVATTKYKHLITSYQEDAAFFRTGVRKFWFALLLVAIMAAPSVGSALGGNYVPYLLNMTGIAAIVALGLNFLTGSGGLVSLGHAAFLAVGAYTAGFLATRLGFPFWMTITLSGLVTGAVGLVVGMPALRLKGIYLALATLAFQMIVGHVVLRWESVTGGANGMAVPPPALGSFVFNDAVRFYAITATVVVLLALGMANLMRSRFGRALVAVRDSDVAAEAMGIPLARYKTMAFGISAAYTGVAGSLMAHYLGYIGPDHFTVLLSIEYLAMILVGGVGSILGSILGAFVITLLPEEIKAGRFREDLFYRLSVFPLRLPPLRERRTDIPLLARHFLERYASSFHQECPGFAPDAIQALSAYDWPGNVRELANEVQRALVLAEPGAEIGLAELSEKISGGRLVENSHQRAGALRAAVETVELDLIQTAYENHAGNKTHMAEELGISRWTLLQKMRAYGIERDDSPDES